MENTSQKRQIAYVVSIKEILEGKYVKQEGWEPNYLITKDKKVSRINVMGVIVDQSINQDLNYNSITIDDGERIAVRQFGEITKEFQPGNCVLVIGRVREFNEERYVVSEIIKKVDEKWLKYRKKYLEVNTQEKPIIEEKEEKSAPPQNNKENFLPVETVYNIIKKLDDGSGVTHEDISNESKLTNIDEIIGTLLKEGEIFELKPGVLKVLE